MPNALSLDDLPFNPQERFVRLEEILSTFRPQYDAALQSVRQAQQETLAAITAFLDEQRLPYTFEKSKNPLDIDPTSATIEGVNGRLIVEGTVEEELAERIKAVVQQAGLHVVNEFTKLRANFTEYGPIAHDSIMKYSRIDVIGGEDPNAHKAVIFVVGRSAYEIGMLVDMATGDAKLEGIAGDPQHYLREEGKSQILIDHAHCDHNTYVVSHPSKHIDFDDLTRHAIQLVFNRCPGYRAAITTKQALDETGAHPLLADAKRSGRSTN